MNLTSPQIVNLITVAGADVVFTTSWSDVDKTGATAYSTGSDAGAVAGAATSMIVDTSGSALIYRVVTGISIYNDHATDSTVVQVAISTSPVVSATLAPGQSLIYEAGTGWSAPTQARETLDGFATTLIKVGTAAEAAGQYYSWAKDSGAPGAWAPGTPGVNGRATDGTAAGDAGCLPIKNPSSGGNYLTGVTAATSVACNAQLYDVLWVNSGIVVTTVGAQAIAAPVALPARDVNGASAGAGCLVGILVTTATTNGAAVTNTTLSYTNSDGTGGRTATMASFPQTAVIGTVVWFQLAAGDSGIQQIDSITLGTSYVTGAISLIIARRLAAAPCLVVNAGAGAPIDPQAGVRIYDGTCALPIGLMTATTATTLTMTVSVAVKS